MSDKDHAEKLIVMLGQRIGEQNGISSRTTCETSRQFVTENVPVSLHLPMQLRSSGLERRRNIRRSDNMCSEWRPNDYAQLRSRSRPV
jgi:hypothetical protein